jgi:hypothetical protein
VVTYLAGAAAPEGAPHAARLAIKMLTMHWYENRELIAANPKIAQIPYAVDALLAQAGNGAY